ACLVLWQATVSRQGPRSRQDSPREWTTYQLLLDEHAKATRRPARRGFRCQTRVGGPRGWLGPARMPTGVGCSAGSRGTAAAATGSTSTKAVGGDVKEAAWARPRQHSCCWAAAGAEPDLPSG